MRHHSRKEDGKGGFVCLTLLYHCSSLKEVRTRTQGRNLEVGADAEAMEERCLLPLVCSVCFFIKPRTYGSSGMVPPTMDPPTLDQ